jgi:hypothetical protein
MSSEALFDESDQLAQEFLAQIDLPLLDDSARVRLSGVACSMSLEHWHAARALFCGGLLPSGLVVHRAQFESVVRSIWIVYAASEEHIAKLYETLTLETEQGAKNLPQLTQMMDVLSKKGPSQAYVALSRFKENSWKALNSYVHAGIHPLRRHEDGYPTSLLYDVLRNANGVGLISAMHAVVLAGRQPLQHDLLAIAARHPGCMPSRL